ncbi:hypothetical protein BDY17DRAFT_163564 [Neohortaea acidophila]|uniref:Uncharacterized protein n=1 Tax=Neohortaea acidophila TaxID=245834 RepID=A0A6A6PRM4_9PEZI|nr:uncharacterized protein BDY17DRAFT_163564 [Neohortaea acidophila]KAF2482642.1 hypothetical protein BDY17DRAFT_163564 [Neohortaea acidophila]
MRRLSIPASSKSSPDLAAPASRYRHAKPLNPALLDLCQATLEEKLYSQAFALLSAALTAGTGSLAPAHLPPPHYLAFAATLVVHPQLTSRTSSTDKHAAADDALRYLRHVNAILGPRNASLHHAFCFNADALSSRFQRAKSRASELISVEEDVNDASLHSTYANQGSLWNQAPDFWSIVGWALNCAVAHPKRWARWKLLLAFLLDVLEDDLAERLPAAKAAYQSGGTTAVQESLKDSLFAHYLSLIGQGRNNKRRVMRAIFANGSSKSLAEFGEIWRNETKPPKQPREDLFAKRRKLDLDNGEFGDYLDESDEDSPGGSLRRSRSATAIHSAPRSNTATDGGEESDEESSDRRPTDDTPLQTDVEAWGGMDAVRLRQRLLAFLAHFCAANPNGFLDSEDLFDLYTEFIRPLPLPVFQQFTLPAKAYLPQQSQASLNQMLLRPLLVATAPPYSETPPTQGDFETYYAPHAASNTSAVDNAKVSLLLESLLRSLWTTGGLAATRGLRNLVQQGITARTEKTGWDGRKKVGFKASADKEALNVLKCSSERMQMMLDMTT